MATHLWYKKKALIYQAAIPGSLARLLPRSQGHSTGLGGGSGGGEGLSAGARGSRPARPRGAGKVAFPAQTRQGNKIFGIRRDFQITKIENSSEVALILGFSLEMSLHP